MAELDVVRATAIINKGIQHGWYQDGAMPAADADKKTVASQIVELARQCEAVKNQVGPDKVPAWAAAEEILAEASGNNGVAPQPAVPALPQVPVPAAPPIASAPPPPPPVPAPAPPVQQASPVQPPAPPPPPTPAPSPQPAQASDDGPNVGDVWADAQGNEWKVERYEGGPTLEARSGKTGDVTLIPVGFLKSLRSRSEASPPVAPPEPAAATLASQPPEMPPAPSAPSPPVPSPSAPPSLVPDGAKPGDPIEVNGVTYYVNFQANGLSTTPPANAPSRVAPQPPAVVSQPLGVMSGQGVTITEVTSKATSTRAPDVPDVHDVPDDQGDERYAALLDETEARYSPAGMTLPHELDEPPQIMPDDLTLVDGVEVRKLHSQFNALSALAKRRHDLEDSRARACDMIRKLHMKPAMRAARESLGSSASVTEVKELAEDDETVAMWSSRKQDHADKASAYKTFFDIYMENVKVLSRDVSMREVQVRGA